jgi:hypothetical protein
MRQAAIVAGHRVTVEIDTRRRRAEPEHMDERAYSPVDVARRLALLGVVINPTVVWQYLRTRLADRYPERLQGLSPASLPVAEAELEEWLEDVIDEVEAERARLSRAMNPNAD